MEGVKEKAAPLTLEQKRMLVALITENHEVLEKNSDIQSISRKSAGWQKIADTMNAAYSTCEPRTVVQLKRAWEYLRNNLKNEGSKEKAAPLTPEQKRTLVALINENRVVLEKNNDIQSISRKSAGWQKVADGMNAAYANSEPKSVVQLKRAWEYLRNKVKKDYDVYAKKKNSCAMLGGPPPSPPKYDPLMDAVANLLIYADGQYDSSCHDDMSVNPESLLQIELKYADRQDDDTQDDSSCSDIPVKSENKSFMDVSEVDWVTSDVEDQSDRVTSDIEEQEVYASCSLLKTSITPKAEYSSEVPGTSSTSKQINECYTEKMPKCPSDEETCTVESGSSNFKSKSVKRKLSDDVQSEKKSREMPQTKSDEYFMAQREEHSDINKKRMEFMQEKHRLEVEILEKQSELLDKQKQREEEMIHSLRSFREVCERVKGLIGDKENIPSIFKL